MPGAYISLPMTPRLVRAVALGLAAGLAAVTAAPAQEAAEPASEAEPLTTVQLWEADPTRIFDASEVTLEEFLWVARPVVVFADSPNDPSFRRQMEFLAERPEDLAERDVLLVVDTDPGALSPIREQLRPRGFMLAIIGKDGQIKLRKPLPWDVRELTRSIDKMPLRRQEIDEARGF